MKILVVDDNPRRYERLIGRAVANGMQRDDIRVVTSANDARDALEDARFDLMVLDIIIPLRPETEPDSKHSIELLTEVLEFGGLNRPGQIVGLSASDEAAVAATPFFSDRLWTVIRYEEGSDGWLSQIENCLAYLSSDTAGRQSFQSDLVVICALDDPELQAVLALPWAWRPACPLDDVTFVYQGSLEIAGAKRTIVAAAASRMGMVASGLLAAKLVDRCRPKVLAMAGICAGVRGKSNIGDVLLADPTWDWQSGKRMGDGERSSFLISPHQLPVDTIIRSRFEQLRSDRSVFTTIAGGWKDAPSIPKLVIGPVASGSAVLADGSIAQAIREQHRDLCGIEMEAYGVYAAAAMASPPRPLAFSLKSVCDFADLIKADDHQPFAAYVSANTLRFFLEKFGSSLMQ